MCKQESSNQGMNAQMLFQLDLTCLHGERVHSYILHVSYNLLCNAWIQVWICNEKIEGDRINWAVVSLEKNHISSEADFFIVLLPSFVFSSHPSSLILTAIIIFITAFLPFAKEALWKEHSQSEKWQQEKDGKTIAKEAENVSGFQISCLQRCWR